MSAIIRAALIAVGMAAVFGAVTQVAAQTPLTMDRIRGMAAAGMAPFNADMEQTGGAVSAPAVHHRHEAGRDRRAVNHCAGDGHRGLIQPIGATKHASLHPCRLSDSRNYREREGPVPRPQSAPTARRTMGLSERRPSQRRLAHLLLWRRAPRVTGTREGDGR